MCFSVRSMVFEGYGTACTNNYFILHTFGKEQSMWQFSLFGKVTFMKNILKKAWYRATITYLVNFIKGFNIDFNSVPLSRAVRHTAINQLQKCLRQTSLSKNKQPRDQQVLTVTCILSSWMDCPCLPSLLIIILESTPKYDRDLANFYPCLYYNLAQLVAQRI